MGVEEAEKEASNRAADIVRGVEREVGARTTRRRLKARRYTTAIRGVQLDYNSLSSCCPRGSDKCGRVDERTILVKASTDTEPEQTK